MAHNTLFTGQISKLIFVLRVLLERPDPPPKLYFCTPSKYTRQTCPHNQAKRYVGSTQPHNGVCSSNNCLLYVRGALSYHYFQARVKVTLSNPASLSSIAALFLLISSQRKISSSFFFFFFYSIRHKKVNVFFSS